MAPWPILSYFCCLLAPKSHSLFALDFKKKNLIFVLEIPFGEVKVYTLKRAYRIVGRFKKYL